MLIKDARFLNLKLKRIVKADIEVSDNFKNLNINDYVFLKGFKNSFMSDFNLNVIEKSRSYGVTEAVVVSDISIPEIDGIKLTQLKKVGADFDFSAKHSGLLYLESMQLKDEIIDHYIDYILSNNQPAYIKCSVTLTEVGEIDNRYKVSPIMLVHKLGILQNANIIGGVYLDKDDVDIMVQCGASLTVTPSFDMGYGNGNLPLITYLSRGLKLNIGTGDSNFNLNGDILEEIKLLNLVTSANMNLYNGCDIYELMKQCVSEKMIAVHAKNNLTADEIIRQLLYGEKRILMV